MADFKFKVAYTDDPNKIQAAINAGTIDEGDLIIVDENGSGSIKFITNTKELIGMDTVIKGYLDNNQFYSDSALTEVIAPSVNKIYVDANDSTVYVFNGVEYVTVSQAIDAATDIIAGVVKLYDGTGSGTDGTMTQSSITEALANKVELTVGDADDELLIFTTQ